MQCDFSGEKKALQTSVRRFFRYNSPNSAARAVMEGDAGHDEAKWRKVGEQTAFNKIHTQLNPANEAHS